MEINLPSGAKLSITVSSFEDAMSLQEAIGEAMGDFSFPKDWTDTEISTLGILSNPGFLSLLANKVKSVMISKKVRTAIFKCFERVTYNDARLSRSLFDDPQMAEALYKDYYTICWEVIKANCLPFFEQIFSKLRGSLAAGSSTPEQK